MGLFDDIAKTGRQLAKWIGESDEDVPAHELSKALRGSGLAEPTEEHPRAMFHDPYSVMDWGGWRQRPSSLTYEALREMASQNTVIASIIKLRTNQVASFARPQQGQYDKGYRVMLRDRRDNAKSMTKAEQAKASELEKMLESTGMLLPDERPADRDNFRSFSKKAVRDVLTYDQLCVEKIRDRAGRVSRFVCLPGETIRPAVNDTEHLTPEEARSRVAYVQVYDETIISEFGVDDLAWCVANPRSDLRTNGFGLAPTEELVRLVTAWLYGFEYNCLDGASLIHTDRGHVALSDLVGESFRIWDGQGWHGASAVQTGVKELCHTDLENGLRLDTSPEHLFRAIPADSDSGQYEWVRQEQLREGDYVMIDAQPSDPPFNYEMLCVGKVFETDRITGREFLPTRELVEDLELWEMLGFALGDGHLSRNQLQIFPHYHNDAHLFGRFKQVCDRHGIAIQDSVVQGGNRKYPCLRVFHTAFVKWLLEIGMKVSSDGKRFPFALFQQPEKVRAAFLRGLFSADGHTRTHKTGYRTPTLCVTDDVLRHDVFRALFSVGVASGRSGKGRQGRINIRVQDVAEFCEQIGYLQEYKNRNIERSHRSCHRWDLVHPVTSALTVDMVRSHENWLSLPAAMRGTFYTAALGKGMVSRPRLIEALSILGEPIPEELECQMVRVERSESFQTSSMMFDVLVENSRNLFFANGMAVHNTNFFKQGTAIKGLLNIKGSLPDRQLRAFRRMWYSMISGVSNSWKTPILNSEDIQWVPMHVNNREMEYGAWMDWITKLTCAIYGVDPLEINFIFGNSGQTSSLGQSRPNSSEVTESKDKGLVPLMDHLADFTNRHIIWEIAPELEFTFAGFDAQAEQAERARRKDEASTWRTVDEIRAEQDLGPMPDGKGEVILNPVWLQFVQGQAGGGGDPGEDSGGEDFGFGDDGDSDAGDGESDKAYKQSQDQASKAAGAAMELTTELLRKGGRTEQVQSGRRHIEIEVEPWASE